MSALSDLQKKLEQEAQGIMFPFSASAANVSTTQNVYDSATDGIMTMQGQKYVGPDAVIQYGTEEQDFQRQLKQIEAPMLPQFDSTQFPQAGEGIMQTPTPAPAPPTTPVEPEAPAIDPCPPGFKFDPVKKVCVPIEQPQDKDDRQPTLPKKRGAIGSTARGIQQVTDAIAKDGPGNFGEPVTYTINNNNESLSKLGTVGFIASKVDKFLKDRDLQNLAKKIDGMEVTKDNKGNLITTFKTEEAKLDFQREHTAEHLKGNVASTQKTKFVNGVDTGELIIAPNGQPMIVGPISMQSFGKVDPEQFRDRDLPSETPEPERQDMPPISYAATGLTTGFGELQTIPKVNSQTEEFVGTVNSRLMEDTGTSLKLASTLMNMEDTARELINPVTASMAAEKLKEQEEDAFNQFNQSIEEDRKKGGDYANNLTQSQARYLNSNNRRALPGESKGNDGYLAGAKQSNKTKENSGYGFKATQANYKKSTNTFDQRFK